MTPADKIRDLQRQIQAESAKIERCTHIFGAAFYNPETVREAYGFKTVKQGSDIWSEPEGYHDVSKARWTKTCTNCGFAKHTNKQKVVTTIQEPDFN